MAEASNHPKSDFTIGDKVRADYSEVGHIVMMGISRGMKIAKVKFSDGFENWYPWKDLIKLPKEK
jgi:hypothetical protein